MAKTFKKKKENFVCQHCGLIVLGDGYTNHCPSCLWSKHVDVFPGDRAASCGGMMAPISAFLKKGQYVLVHRCLKCGYKKNNKAAKNDSRQKIIDLSVNATDLGK